MESEDESVILRNILKYYDKHKGRPSRDSLVEELREEANKFGWDPSDSHRIQNRLEEIYKIQNSQQDLSSVREKTSNFARKQALRGAILQSVDELEAYDKEPHEKHLDTILTSVQSALLVGSTRNIGFNAMEFLSDPKALCDVDAFADPKFRVKSGYLKMDEYMEGGLGPGEIGFIIAESNKGKSMMLTNLAANAVKQGKRVVYVSLELKPAEVALRIYAKLTDCTIAQCRRNDPQFASRVNLIERNLPGRQLQVVYYPPSKATPTSIRSTLANIESSLGWTPEVLIIDYIDEMRSSNWSPNSEENTFMSFGNITTDLIEIAVDYKCPVWSACQVNRDGYGKDPSLDNMGRSLQKVEKADFIVSICQDAEEEKKGKIRLKMLKMRRGTGKNNFVHCITDFTKAKIAEAPSNLREERDDETEDRCSGELEDLDGARLNGKSTLSVRQAGDPASVR